jgi:hypothetical protein
LDPTFTIVKLILVKSKVYATQCLAGGGEAAERDHLVCQDAWHPK